MKEKHYIDATNLAKVRIALQIVRDLLDSSPEEEQWRQQMLITLSNWQEKLEKAVR